MYIADNLRKVLNGEAEPVIKPEETINAARIIEMFYKSAEKGAPVNISEIQHPSACHS